MAPHFVSGHHFVSGLRSSLESADYVFDSVAARIQPEGEAGLQRNSTIPALDLLGDADDPQAQFIRLWLLAQPVSEASLSALLALPELLAAGLIEVKGGRVHPLVSIVPYATDQGGSHMWVVCDIPPILDQQVRPTRTDFVLGASPASTSLAQLTMRTPVQSALDLGTGCGVQTLHLAQHVNQIVATDINPRALYLAEITTSLNEVDVDLRAGSLYQPVSQDRFDLIVTNPPYVMSPPGADGTRLTYREGDFAADGLMEHIVRNAPNHLNPGGSLQVLGSWAVVKGQSWQDRLIDWTTGSGCDLWVVEREQMDIYDYIELWLADAGYQASLEWSQKYRTWLDYFRSLNIESVGMGWLLLTNAGRDFPDIQVESWPHPVQQPVGTAMSQHHNAVSAAQLPLQSLLEHYLIREDSVWQETVGEPGAENPEHIIMRSGRGLRRHLQTDTLLAAVIGACDGDLTFGQIVGALADITDTSSDEVMSSVDVGVRDALRSQLLYLRTT